MAEVQAAAEQVIDAPVERVRAVLADYQGRKQWLPPEYSDVRVEPDGTFAYRLSVGRRVRDYRMRPESGPQGPMERDTGSSLVTSWLAEPSGAGTRVRVETRWQGAGGVGGFFERTFAPRALGALHARTLQALAKACS